MTNRIDGHARMVAQLPRGAKYTIDSFPRECARKHRQTRELVDTLTGNWRSWPIVSHDRATARDR